MPYTPDHYAAALRSLLAPTWPERRAADALVNSLFGYLEKDADGRWQGIAREAIERLNSEAPRYFGALIDYAAVALAGAHQAWTNCMHDLPPPPPARLHDADYPLADALTWDHPGLFGMGLAKLLEGIGPVAASRAPTLAAIVEQHPRDTLGEAAFLALGSIGTNARVALPTLLANVRSTGQQSSPDHRSQALARVIGDDPAAYAEIARSIDPRGDFAQVDGACALLACLPVPQPTIAEILLSKVALADEIDARTRLLMLAASLCPGEPDVSARCREVVLGLVADTDADLRAAAAIALGHVGDPTRDMSSLVALARDPQWQVRNAAYLAAGTWPRFDLDVLAAAGADLGCYDGYDGEPHYSALNLLIGAGHAAAPLVARLRDWLQAACADDGFDLDDGWERERLAHLVEALGPDAHDLREALEDFLLRYDDDADEGDPDDDEDLDSDEDAADDADGDTTDDDSPAIALARRLGLPIDADLPGSPVPAERGGPTAPPTPEQRIRRVLAEWDRVRREG